MVKNIFKAMLKILIIILIYLLQIYVVNNTAFFGVIGNLPLMVVALVTLMGSNVSSYVISSICGVLSDLLFPSIPFKNLVIYTMVVTILIGLKKLYKQDSKIAIIIFSALATVASEILMLVFYVVSVGEFVNIFSYIFVIFKECIINICLAFIIYLVLRFCKKEG